MWKKSKYNEAKIQSILLLDTIVWGHLLGRLVVHCQVKSLIKQEQSNWTSVHWSLKNRRVAFQRIRRRDMNRISVARSSALSQQFSLLLKTQYPLGNLSRYVAPANYPVPGWRTATPLWCKYATGGGPRYINTYRMLPCLRDPRRQRGSLITWGFEMRDPTTSHHPRGEHPEIFKRRE